ncbi:MAG: response regulator transcription factor [Vulcanibacillus sp.]
MSQTKILIIEDEVLISEILFYKLSKEDYEVKCSRTGQEGLDTIPCFTPDLLLLDITLPDILGFDICREIKGKYLFPIIMLTSRNSVKDRAYGLELGAIEYITKPFDMNELLRIIKKTLNQKKVTYAK